MWMLLWASKTIWVRLQKLLSHKCGPEKIHQISVDFTSDLWTVEISTVLTDFGGISTLCQTLWEGTNEYSAVLKPASSLNVPSAWFWSSVESWTDAQVSSGKHWYSLKFTSYRRGGRIFHQNQRSCTHLWGTQVGPGWSQKFVWSLEGVQNT